MEEHGHSPEEIRTRIGAPRGRGYLRDVVYGAIDGGVVVYGAIDGGVTTFAIVAGVAGAGLSPLVIVALGLANVFADGFSMAAGNYSATKSEVDDIRRLRAVEMRHIATDPEGERREVREILRQKGLSGDVLEEATAQITSRREPWLQMMLEGEYGLGSVAPHPMRAALATFAAFLVTGMVPLLPFLFGMENAFRASSVATLTVFFAIGGLKSLWSLAPWWRSGLETLLIGGAAAAVAYGIGSLF